MINVKSLLRPLLGALLIATLMIAGEPAAASPTQVPSASIPVDPVKTGRVVSVPYSATVAAFPTSVSGYRLREKKVRSEVRLFQGGKWQALPPMDEGLAGHCDAAIWVVRWRSRNPDVTVASALGDTAFPGFNRLGSPSVGGAGHIYGNACVSPGLKFASAINGNRSNLVDVDYEYQIWLPNRKI